MGGAWWGGEAVRAHVPTMASVPAEEVMVDAGRWQRAALMRMGWEHVPTCAVGVVCKVAVVVVVVALL